ncbi:MAG: chorismate-binding protein [Bdellovibrio sp.]|nr:chorismate-binding protein [Bdellovibrio sp.]
MTPLICFYEKDLFIFSLDYEVHHCPAQMRVADFLNTIEKEFFNAMKVIQCNFEFDSMSAQKALYNGSKASVFVIQNYALKTLAEITAGDVKNISHQFKPLVSREQFTEQVKIIKGQIAEGRIYQVNLTAPLAAACNESGLDIFNYYQAKFNSEYKAFLPYENYSLISLSPELFLQRVKNQLITRPIKGSSSAEKDFSTSLYKNEKEEAELSMIVDLLRNDLNNLDENQASVVTKHREKMQLGYIQHTYSEIQVSNDQPLASILQKTMPGGSISGCPKIESLKVINELEPYRRQAYTGTLGWWQKNDFTLNLTIRTFIKSHDLLVYHAGCGIVYDSDPESEWDEFLLKTGSLHVTK